MNDIMEASSISTKVAQSFFRLTSSNPKVQLLPFLNPLTKISSSAIDEGEEITLI